MYGIKFFLWFVMWYGGVFIVICYIIYFVWERRKFWDYIFYLLIDLFVYLLYINFFNWLGGLVDILLIIDWEINYIVGMSFYFVFNVFI